MADEILSPQDQQEALSQAYVQAVAGKAGYTISVPNFDRDSIDVTIGAGGRMRPRLDLQLKATINLTLKDGSYSFPLSKKNYDDLRAQIRTPRILVVLDMPRNEREWIEISPQQLILRRAAYWKSLHGLPDSENTSTVTVKIPASSKFDVDGLKALMEQSRRGSVE